MITLICGPMYSGKSTALLQRIERSLYAHRSVLVIRPAKDDRGYLTHTDTSDPLLALSDKFKNNIEVCFTNEITEEVLYKVRNFEEIFVDEYFMIKNCKNLLDSYHQPYSTVMNIYFAGLLASSENTLFDETIAILPYCDKIKKLNGVCTTCGSELGNFTTYQGKAEKTGDILVGDNDYTCHCYNCKTHE